MSRRDVLRTFAHHSDLVRVALSWFLFILPTLVTAGVAGIGAPLGSIGRPDSAGNPVEPPDELDDVCGLEA